MADGRINFTARIDNDKLRSDAAESQNIFGQLGRTAEQEGSNIDAAFRKVGMTIAGVFTAQKALEFAKSIIDVRKEIESLEISFTTLLGNKQKADELFGQIRTFAVNTPMQMKDLAAGAQTLLSFNYEADKVMTTLKALGDISMGDSAKFNSLTLAFAQMSSTGKLMGQDLLQMINAGFNPLATISEQTGKSIGDLKDDMSKGAISAQMVEDAFIAATSAGGKFYGMLDAQSKSIGGALSNLQGAIDDMFNDFGESSQSVITDVVEVLTNLAKNYKDVGEAILALVAIYGTYKAALATTVVVTRLMQAAEVQKNLAAKEGIALSTAQAIKYTLQAKATGVATAATAKLNATLLANPYALAAAAVVALAYGIYKLATYETEAQKAQKQLDDATRECNKAIASEEAQVSYLFNRLKAAKEGTQEYEDAKKAIVNQYGKYLDGLSDEIRSLQDVEGAYKAVASAARDAARARAMEAYTKEAGDTYAQKEADQKEKLYQLLKKKYGDTKDKDGSYLYDKYYWQLVKTLEAGSNMVVNENWLKKWDVKKSRYYANDPASPSAGGQTITWTENEFRDIFNSIAESRKVLDNTMAEAERRFGKAPDQKETPAAKAKTQAEYNKKDWEEYKKAKQGEYDAMTEAQRTSEKGKKLASEILEADKHIQGYNVTSNAKSGASAATKQQREDAQIAVQTAERNQKLQEYADAVVKARREAEFEIEQNAINLMEDGVDKELRQVQLNYDRLIYANQQRQADMVEALRDAKALEWENANTNAKKQGMTFDRSTITADDLSPEQKKTIEEYARIAGEIRVKGEKDALDQMLADVMTYEQTRLKITEEYQKKRDALYETENYVDADGKTKTRIKTDSNGNRVMRSGVTEGNLAELNRQEEESLKAIDDQFASREAQYQAWCDAIGNLSLKQLEDLLAKAQEELNNLQANGGGGTNLATARAKVNKLTETVKQQKATDEIAPKKRTIKEWQNLYSALNECTTAFNDIGDAVGGTAGEIIKVAGQISTSTLQMINGIVTLANNSGNAMSGTAAAASTAIQTVEKASVILAVISAALQIATAIANLFNNDDKKQEEIEDLQERIDQLQWELDNRDVLRINEEYGTSMKRVREAIYNTRIELINAAIATGNWGAAWKAAFGKISSNSAALEKTAESLASTYESMSYTAGKALGENRYNDYYDQLKNISKQQILMQEQIAEEQSKKDTDDSQIAEWQQKIEELGEEAKAIIDDLMEDIIGYSADELASELSDAFFEAFENGEDAAEAWGDKVKEVTADIVKNMLVQQLLEEEIGKVFDKYKSQWFKNGEFVGTEGVKDSMSNFMNDLLNIESTMEQVWNAIPDELKEYLTSDAERDGTTTGIANASQDSVDELNARATTIQSHTFSISENTKLLVANTNAILGSVQAIEQHTESISKRMETVETGVKYMRNTLDDIQTQGLKVK